MNEKIKSVVTTVKTKWTDASKMAKILVISIPIVVIAIIIVLCIILNNTGKNTAVLFSGLSNSEAGEIASAIQALDGAPEVTVNAKGDVIVPAERADSIRMQMWAQGYPKSTTNYDIWDNGVDLWSTDMDKREIKRQQLETRLGSTISSMDKIQAATVNLTLPETSNYVISTEKGDSGVPPAEERRGAAYQCGSTRHLPRSHHQRRGTDQRKRVGHGQQDELL